MVLRQINEVERSFECKFEMIFKWVDPRIQYRFLYGYHKILWKATIDEIWLPGLYIDDTIGPENNLKSNSLVYIEMEGSPEKATRRHLHEALVFDGKENHVVYSEILDETLYCDFQLHYYPFDTQVCSVVLRVPLQKIPVIDLEPGMCEAKEEISLSQYFVLDMNTRVSYRHNYTIECEITLKRNPSFHIVSTYLPTLILMVTALATLFVDEAHFEATIIVAMTSMLVMFTLHQNVQSHVPYTAYLKLVDYWLIYGTILPFIVFIVEIAWELGVGDKKNQNMVQRITSATDEVSPNRNYFKIIPKYGLVALTLVFVVAYATYAIYLLLAL